MRLALAIALCAGLILPASALDPGNQAPSKPTVPFAPPPAGDVPRQGGDTIATAVAITVPASLTGTTAPYIDDYDEVCPYIGSDAHDVVYSVTPPADVAIDLDLYGSAYDTKIYVYDAGLNLLGCNDDYYEDFTSRLENVALAAGEIHYVVVDGYAGQWGDYVLNVTEFVPCELDCPAGAVLEGEPPLFDGYEDLYNSGCGGASGTPMQAITQPLFCGRAGWYLGSGGVPYRDTDWFVLVLPPSGVLEITGDAEWASQMMELGPQDCASVDILQYLAIGPCAEATMTLTGTAGATVWFWVGSATFEAPPGFVGHEYDYVLQLTFDPVAVEHRSWTEVKGLFD
ncbi:MAG TPA: hypothetical protein PLL30_12595 [Candidatus Krumholzibacteria bacterium]|nr:hypothetical protein [Candidatus Krumholzibacteria bacterium]HPD72607.1 hypothetical protein [Candidatus Krumholzibacteria bacterium]HRY40461.1 hypothetical protein [Candidatus Krumholzibacteria bacterium]